MRMVFSYVLVAMFLLVYRASPDAVVRGRLFFFG